MHKVMHAVVTSTLVFGLFGCGQAETPAPKVAKTTPAVVSQPVVQETKITAAAVVPKDITYRSVKATLRENGEAVEIMVPDDMDVDSGRLLEYREGPDGKLYMKSVIPN